jgi:hypothetical protein
VEEPKPSPAPRPSPKPGAGDDGAPTSSPDVSSATPGTPRPQPSPTPGSADGGQAGKEDPQAAAALLAQQTEDWKALVKGYTSIPVKNIASSQVLYPPAFAVGTTKDGAALLSAVRYGQGRVVVAGHEGMLGSCCSFEDMGGFTMNAIAWAAGNTSSPKIAANDAMFGDAIRALSANKVRGMQCRREAQASSYNLQPTMSGCPRAACASSQWYAAAQPHPSWPCYSTSAALGCTLPLQPSCTPSHSRCSSHHAVHRHTLQYLKNAT